MADVLTESVSDGSGGRAAEVVNQYFNGVAPAFEQVLRDSNGVVWGVGRKPGLNEVTVDVNEGIAAGCEC